MDEDGRVGNIDVEMHRKSNKRKNVKQLSNKEA